MKLSITEEQLKTAEELLPATEFKDVNGIMRDVPISYLVEIVGAEEKTSAKSGDSYLVVKVASDLNSLGVRKYVERMFSYKDRALSFLYDFFKKLEIQEPYDTDDIIGKFVWIKISHEVEKYIPKGKAEEVSVTKMVIKEFERLATVEEVQDLFQKTGRAKRDSPF